MVECTAGEAAPVWWKSGVANRVHGRCGARWATQPFGRGVGREGVKQRVGWKAAAQPRTVGRWRQSYCPQWMVRRRPCDAGLNRDFTPAVAVVRGLPAPLMSDIAGAKQLGDDQVGTP